MGFASVSLFSCLEVVPEDTREWKPDIAPQATVVNRIPDIINARPGFVPTAEIGELNFKTKALNEYVK